MCIIGGGWPVVEIFAEGPFQGISSALEVSHFIVSHDQQLVQLYINLRHTFVPLKVLSSFMFDFTCLKYLNVYEGWLCRIYFLQFHL